MNQELLSERIRQKRAAEGLSVVELSEKLRVSKANLYKWEKGHKPSDPEDYRKIESWLGEKIETVPRADNIDAANLNPDRLLKILENLSQGHKEACESVNKMADNERMILLKIPTEGVHEGIVLTDPSILIPLAQVLAEISMGKLKFHTTEEALAELGIRLGLHKPYKGKTKGIHVDAGK